jgi:hypothetical protein
MTDKGIKQLIKDLYHWAYTNEHAFHLSQFLRLRGLPKSSFHRWLSKYPQLKEAWSDIKYMLAGRIFENAMVGKYSGSLAQYVLPKMDPEWDEVSRYHASLKMPDDKSVTIDVIKMPAFLDKPDK